MDCLDREDKNMKKTAEELIQFIKESPDAFHAAAAVTARLKEEGYEEYLSLFEDGEK